MGGLGTAGGGGDAKSRSSETPVCHPCLALDLLKGAQGMSKRVGDELNDRRAVGLKRTIALAKSL